MNRTTRLRRTAAGLTAGALAAAGLTALGLVTAAPASAAAITVDDARFAWSINDEVNAGAFAPGTWNLMSAGRIGDPGAGGQTLTTASSGARWANGATAGWRSTDGNVTIEDRQADGGYAPATFQGTRTNSAGTQTNTANGTGSVLAETRLVLDNGTGTLDPQTDDAKIAWDGDATVLFYSGMTFFHLSDPTLDVVGGEATLRATVGGYATDMNDSTKWTRLPDRSVVLATASNVDITAAGLTGVVKYLQQPYEATGEATPQSRANAATWGSFPQAFVDYQQQLGSGSYWYSSGGSADARKPAKPFTVTLGAPARVSVSRTTLLPSGAQEVTVTGTGFKPALATGSRPPLAGRPAGAYVVFSRFATAWRPSDQAPSTARPANRNATRWAVLAEDMAAVGGPAAGAIELTPAGTFTTTLVVDQADVAAISSGNYGVFTYAGGGATQALYETYTPITFAPQASSTTLSAAPVTFGQPATATVRVAGGSGPVTLTRSGTPVGTTTPVGGVATFALGTLPAGSHALVASYAGDVNSVASSASTTLTVARASSATSTAVTKKPVLRPRKKAGAVQVRVTSPTTTVSGPATAVLAQGRKTVRTLRLSLSGGTARAALPKLGRGVYTLRVSYPGTADVAGSTSTTKIRVR